MFIYFCNFFEDPYFDPARRFSRLSMRPSYRLDCHAPLLSLGTDNTQSISIDANMTDDELKNNWKRLIFGELYKINSFYK